MEVFPLYLGTQGIELVALRNRDVARKEVFELNYLAVELTEVVLLRDRDVVVSGDREFESVELGDVRKKKKIPRRIIHFASGETMEEYSTDEEEDLQEKRDLLPTVDPAKLTWGPYLWFYMLRVATSTLSVCDFLGEKIASVLGVSTPKYQYAIDEYYRMQKEVYAGRSHCSDPCSPGHMCGDVCDFLGEKIASVLGVSTPKYQYAIDEYYRMQKEVEEEEEENELSEQAEKQFQEQNWQQHETTPQLEQPEAASSFVNISFVMEGDDSVNLAQKQELSAVPT
ncbi:unnamed protein product [Ranitomeya imitator]|uniref:Protein FAM177A1 n=1 Tax=Ranitomeya imitator TaxID=111125 RepID=A0ABN9L5F3_9NEOB|nr:unnamed protein product [Ranitomeya imitator]